MLEDIVKIVEKLGAKEITFSFIKPVGAAKNSELLLTVEERKELINKVLELKKIYADKIIVSSSDPLRVLCDSHIDKYLSESDNELILGGCIAGIAAFNVNVDGGVTPCSMIFDEILNIKNHKTIESMLNAYTQSPIVKGLASKDLNGACGSCRYKYLCGGCRAMAQCVTGDLLGSDTLCWLNQ